MAELFSYKLGMTAKRVLLDGVPGVPEGRFFGVVRTGIALPEAGAFYLVEFETAALTQARILAYADKYGRMFATDEALSVPPARYPTMRAFAQQGAEFLHGYLVSCARDGRETVLGGYECKNPGGNERYRLESAESGAFASVELPDAWKNYDEFMAGCYLGFIAFADRQRTTRLYDLGAVFDRFDEPNLFDAVNREVLEVESSLGDEAQAVPAVERYLAHMLRDAGVVGETAESLAVDLPDGMRCVPEVRLLRTAMYANTFYVDFYYMNDAGEVVENGLFASTDATREARAALLRTESALNRFLFLTKYLEENFEGGAVAADEAFCCSADAWLSDRICLQAGDVSGAALCASRWDKHLAFARACERLFLPYRLGYDFCSNEAGTAFGVKVTCPTAEVMPLSTWDEGAQGYRACSAEERQGAAARYAAHAAILMAAQAFSVSSDVDRVFVDCLNGGRDADVVVRCVFDRPTFVEAFSTDEERAVTDPFSFLCLFDTDFGFAEGYRLMPVDSCFARGEGEFASDREILVHRDDTPFSEAARELTGVFAPCDMSIFEGGDRAYYADEVVEALDQGIEAAVACLHGIHDRTENILVRRICRELLDGFASGRCDETSYLEVKEAFTDPYGFKPLMARAMALVRSDEESQAIAVLDELLAKVEATDAFADTAQTCYRFFDSYETRYMYARHCADNAEGRRVLPLPDEVFFVHDALTQIYTGSITGLDAAIEHANKCIELAPSRAYSYLRLARIYFMQGDYERELELCAKALTLAWHPGDAGLALYWSAYAFWKLERYDAAAACYRRCAVLNMPLSEQAKVEFEELIESVKGLQRHSEAEEDEILRKEGFPVGTLRANCESMLELAKASADSGCDSLCCIMAAAGMRVVRDDALMPLLKSFTQE